MARRLILWGAGGHAKVVADIARAAGWVVVGLVDHKRDYLGHVREPGGARVLYDEAEFLLTLSAPHRPFDAAVVAFGANAPRLQAVQKLQEHVEVPVLVHPSATLSPSSQVGAGSVVMPHVVVNAATTVGTAAILNTSCVVEHDCVLGDGIHVSPNATVAGSVRIGPLSWVGAGATIIQNITIGSSVTIGAGAVVIRDVADGLTVVGCPAAATGWSPKN